MDEATDVREQEEWTRLGANLWAGRSDGRPIGTIEHGRRYHFVDLDGAASPGYRTLAAAQHARSEGAIPRVPSRAGVWARWFLLSAGGATAVSATALLVMAARQL